MKHYTTIEQSKKLLELGLSPKTADMVYMCIDIVRGLKYSLRVVEGLPEHSDEYDVPCCSLGALLEMMPEQITYSDFKPFPLGMFKGDKEEHSKYGHYWIQYFATDSGGAHVQTNGHSPIEAAYSMIVWLLENRYIKKRTKDF